MAREPAPYIPPPWSGTIQAGSAPAGIDTPAIDCETAALLRAWACPLMAQAESWADLSLAFAARGYGLAIRDGRLVMTRNEDGAALCSFRFLGTSLREMADRLGRPMVKALPDGSASGEFMTAPGRH